MKKMKLFLMLLMVLTLILPSAAYAAEIPLAETYIYDDAGILPQDRYESLQEQARNLSEYAQCGVYLMIVDDYMEYSSKGDILEAAEELYLDNGLGMGEEQNGIFLLLSMDWRDYALVTYGDFAHMAFTDYGQEMLCEQFLDDFRYDEWTSGCSEYLRYTEVLLDKALAGEPLDVTEYEKGNPVALGKMAILPAALLSLFICTTMKRKMNSAKIRIDASEYVVENSVQLHIIQDLFTHVTHSRTKVNNTNGPKVGGGGGTTIRASGFSGRSGKF
ncbi:MAG: TPM domain-containing protein [Firmicutes bacterium]|nr:TPM domain-containing protein [Bacillota bacterium]